VALTANAAQLRPSATVTDDQIRLGDLFDGMTDQADREVAPAPAPGRQTVLDGDFLQRLAQSYHVDWQPGTADTRIVVTRASRTVGIDELRGAVVEALGRRAVGGRLEVDFDNPTLRVVVAANQPSAISVENLYYSQVLNHFSAEVVIGAGGSAPQRVTVAGHATLMVEMPVLVRRVNPGEVITHADIGWVEINANQLVGNIAASETDLISRTPRRSLPVNAPIFLYDVQPLRLVSKGQMVTMVLQTPTMFLSTQGKATQDGAKGEVIRVQNLESNRIVDATVVGSNQVAVYVPGAVMN
jgi:flagella basal body P-ring formation protein FlgA